MFPDAELFFLLQTQLVWDLVIIAMTLTIIWRPKIASRSSHAWMQLGLYSWRTDDR